jgi:hypothetical protein
VHAQGRRVGPAGPYCSRRGLARFCGPPADWAGDTAL